MDFVLANGQSLPIRAARPEDADLDPGPRGWIIKKINLQDQVDNTRAIDLYLKKGFSIEGRNTCALRVGGTRFDFYPMGIVL